MHLVAYRFLENVTEWQSFLLYAQFGECKDTTKHVFQMNNCDYNPCKAEAFKFTLEVHAFGDGRGRVNYERAIEFIKKDQDPAQMNPKIYSLWIPIGMMPVGCFFGILYYLLMEKLCGHPANRDLD